MILTSPIANTAHKTSQLSESQEDLKQVRVTIFCVQYLGYCNTVTCAMHRRSRGLGTFETEAALSLSAAVCSLDLPLQISKAAEMPPFNFS